MDKYSQREVLDNEWLTREVDLHRRDVDDMRKVVEDLEKGNLEIMAELFECKIEDLKVSRFVLLMNYTCPDQMQDIFALLVWRRNSSFKIMHTHIIWCSLKNSESCLFESCLLT